MDPEKGDNAILKMTRLITVRYDFVSKIESENDSLAKQLLA